MYLDPGSTSLFVQGLFALVATLLATVGRYRAWLSSMWLRVVENLNKSRRSPGT